jgi:hypothetical protein
LFLGISLQGFLSGLLGFSIAATDLLTIEFALNVWCDPKLCSSPHTIHLAGELC